MGRNLTNLYISQSFQFLTQISGSELQTGLGDTITGSLLITASKADTATTAVSASYSNVATSASYALVSTSSSFAINATNASTASIATSASYAVSASQAQNAVTASFALNVTPLNTGSFLTTASISNATTTYTKGDGSTFSLVTNNVVNADSASVATSSSFATTASFASTIANGLSPTFANVTASNVLITGTASVALLYTETISSSVIFSSGSNLLGDSATLDTQTLIGVVTTSGSLSVTGSAGFANGITGSLLGTASFALSASNTPNALVTASASGATITFSKGDGTTFPVSVTATAFPFTGSAAISGTIDFNGKSTQTQNIIKFGGDKGFYADSTGSIAIGFDTYNTSSGRHNIAIGSASLQNGTTAADNVLIGYRTGQLLTTGRQNVIIGTEADGNWTGKNITTGTNNVWIGQGVGNNSTAASSNNILIGYHTGLQGTQGAYNIGLGAATFREGVGAQNVALGDGTMYSATGADRNIAFGNYTLFNVNGDQNIFIGDRLQDNSTSQWTGSQYFALGSQTTAQNALLYGYHGTAIPKFLNINGNLNTSGSLTVTGSIISTNTASFAALSVTGAVSGSVIGNNTDTFTSSPRVQQVVTLTQAEYNAIGSPDANTLYVISGSVPFNSANFATTGSNTFTGNQTINASASADYWLVDTKPFATLSTSTIIAGRIDGADEDFVLAGRNFNGTVPSITMTDGEFIYNEAAHIFTGSVDLDSTLNVVGATTLRDDVTITGSLRGNVGALSISSQTASLDCSTGNFFTLLLVSGSNTFVNPSNILPGQTINLRVKQASVASGSISFASSIKQVSGSLYTPTATANAEDIVTFISFDSTNLYLSNIKNFI